MRCVLTVKGIEGLKPPGPGKRRIVHDGLVPGFGVRITDTGAKSFVLVGRFGGSKNPTARALGKVGAITLEQARVQAREWLGQMATGVDPAEVKRQREEGTLRPSSPNTSSVSVGVSAPEIGPVATSND
jgi:hypothetical protein